MASDSKSWWPLAAVPPCVEGGDGNPEVFGEVLGAEQFIELFHLHIVARVDVNWVTSSCQGCCQRVFGGSSPMMSAGRTDSDSYLSSICNRSDSCLTSILGLIGGPMGYETELRTTGNEIENVRYRTTPGRRPSPPISARPCGPTASNDPRIGNHMRPTEPESTDTTTQPRPTASNRPHPQLTTETPMTTRRPTEPCSIRRVL